MKTRMLISLTVASLLLTSLPSYSDENRGRDPKRVTGGGRGGCDTLIAQDSSADDLVALVPEKGEMLVASTTPSVWFYNPYTPASSLKAKFSLRDENDQLVMELVDIELPKMAGIFSVQMPKPLKQNISYRWYFSIGCDAVHPSKNPLVQGRIRVIEPTIPLKNQLKQASSPVQTATLYMQAGLWNDSLTQAATQQAANTDAKALWLKLLKVENLDAIATKPILPCCIPR